MAVDVFNLSYVPTLAIRASEMNGLEQLPAASKDRLQPIFLLAPWPNAVELMKAVDRIHKAFPDRPYFIDIDRDYVCTNLEAPAQQQWIDLQDPANNYSNWVGFLSSVPDASPCLQIATLSQAEIVEQIGVYQSLGRTFALRIELNRIPSNLSHAVAALNEVGSADFAIIIDAGWLEDTQITRLKFSNIIQNQFSVIDAQIPIVVCYTTIPKDFSNVEGAEFTKFDNRDCISELLRVTNRQKLIYGDWGSTRPREVRVSSRPKPRIDLPLKNGWLTVRNRKLDWDFEDVARALVSNPRWSEVDGLGVWGEVMIKQTVINQNLGISTAQKNIAARVNIHLHTQAFYNDGDIRGLNLDEGWQDD